MLQYRVLENNLDNELGNIKDCQEQLDQIKISEKENQEPKQEWTPNKSDLPL